MKKHQKNTQRQHPRFDVSLPVKYLVNDIEQTSTVLDISFGGASISSTMWPRPSIGDKNVTYINYVERVQGEIVRLFHGGLAVRFTSSVRLMKKTWHRVQRFLQCDEPLFPIDRRVKDRVADRKETHCTLLNGNKISCSLIDFSTVGAAIESTRRPPVNSPVWLGKQKAKIVRHTRVGFAVEFVSYWEEQQLIRPIA